MEEKLVADFFTEEKMHWWHRAKRNLIEQFITGRNLHILVAGVGGGMLCKELKRDGHRVVGMDISQISCEYVNKNIAVPVIRGDLEKPLPFPSRSFDMVIIADVLEHMQSDTQLLAETFSCLRSEGVVIITAPAYAHMWSSWDIRLHHKRRYSRDSIKKVVTSAGFSVKKASYCNMLLYPFAYMYRVILRLPKGKDSERSDFAVTPGRIVPGLFNLYYSAERSLLKMVDLPFGLSVFAIGVKRG